MKKTFCRICEAHWGLIVETDSNNELVKINPDSDHAISEGFVCAK